MKDFIPGTLARSIGDGYFFRPIRSWHSATYAGEGLRNIPNSDDGSGCLRWDNQCSPPLSVTHRLYWHEDNPDKTISAFLSYPNGMGACAQYFWELYPALGGDVECFTGDDAEAKLEEYIKAHLKELTR